jgi:uncharacterized phage-associated protein
MVVFGLNDKKLVYYAQAWSLVLNDKKLFNDSIEAWVHGPAVRSLYVQYKKFGFDPIKETIDASEIKNISGKSKEVLDSVWGLYGKFDAGYLEMLSHNEKPWQEAREGLQGHENSASEISLKTMKTYYSEKLEQAQKKK